MKRQAGHKIRFTICLTCFLLLGTSFLLMPIEGNASLQQYMPILLGTMFWASLIGGIVSYVYFASGIKKQTDQKHKIKRKIGLISFFQNHYAVVADVMMLISLIGGIAMMLLTDGTGYLCYVFIAVFVWSFSMHCVCNGGPFCHWLRQKQDSCTKGR